MGHPLTRHPTTGDFPELDELRTLVKRAGPLMRSQVLCEVAVRGEPLPVYALECGSQDPDAPAVAFVGGVHGVERIGTQVVLSFLHTVIERLRWDQSLARDLDRVRLVFVPLVNPGGMWVRSRANPAGVDLMRNAPIDSTEPMPWMLGGQRRSPRLPWYRGAAGAPMEPEAAALCDFVERRVSSQPFSILVDCHSGFGTRNHVWFPYAGSRRPIDCLADIYALRTLFRSTHPHHSIYIIEPQSRRYMTDGDLWDWLYLRSRQGRSLDERLFLPLTLEMGSWLWVKKNPLQLFDRLGLFNPVEPHRVRRILRQHQTLFDFLVRAAVSHRTWRPTAAARPALFESAAAYWLARPDSVGKQKPE